MEIRHFRYFLCVARHGHFTRAAEQLGIAPPTLSRQIQDMERELGVRLFERNQREVNLTAAGQALLIEAEQAVRNGPAVVKVAVSKWATWPRRRIRGCCSGK
ncbi:DNA-binding transcriptional LysR family regulator [Pseudomonas plecoglossicida]